MKKQITKNLQKIALSALTAIVTTSGMYMFLPIQGNVLELIANSPVDVAQEVQAKEAQKEEKDERIERVDKYFQERNMPLEGYGEQFVKTADKYELDWRLLPAIAVRESSGGKHLMNNNPFGWGSAKIPFEDFNEAIDVVGWNLAGNNPNTAKYYADTTNYEKLWAYNGTVMPTYPDEVIAIMNMF